MCQLPARNSLNNSHRCMLEKNTGGFKKAVGPKALSEVREALNARAPRELGLGRVHYPQKKNEFNV